MLEYPKWSFLLRGSRRGLTWPLTERMRDIIWLTSTSIWVEYLIYRSVQDGNLQNNSVYLLNPKLWSHSSKLSLQEAPWPLQSHTGRHCRCIDVLYKYCGICGSLGLLSIVWVELNIELLCRRGNGRLRRTWSKANMRSLWYEALDIMSVFLYGSNFRLLWSADFFTQVMQCHFANASPCN